MVDSSAFILITLIIYKAALIAIGLISQRRTHDGLDFFLAGRQLGPTVAAISAAASSSSAWTLLGVSGAAYAWGLSSLWIFPACVGGFLINWLILAAPLRAWSHRSGAVTVTEILAGPPSRPQHAQISVVASLIILLSLGTYVASQFQGAAKTFSETFGLSFTHSILLGSGIVILYTLLGGFWAVSITDTLQGLVMAAASLMLPIAALLAVGGPAGLSERLAEVPQADYLSFTRHLPMASAAGFILGLLGIGIGYPGQPHVVNRFMAMRQGRRELQRGRQIAIAWAVLVYSGMLLLGLCGRVLYPGLADREVVFLTATTSLFPPVVAGILIAAVLSAIMSTADSQLLVAGSAVTHDLKLGGGSSRSLLLRSRIVVLLLSLGAVVGAIYGSQQIFSQVLFAWSAMGAAFGPLLLVTVLKGPVSPRATMAAMLAGFALSVAAYWLPETRGGAAERVLPFMVALIISYLGREK